MFNLPPHLQTLNTISSPPSSALTREEEEAFWGFMHTDLFPNFGVAPSDLDDKEDIIKSNTNLDQQNQQSQSQTQPQTLSAHLDDTSLSNIITAPAPTPISTGPLTTGSGSGLSSNEDKKDTSTSPLSATTLESFLAAFASDPSQLLGNSNAPTPLPNANFLLNLPLPFSTSSSTAPTPTPGSGNINTSELLGTQQSQLQQSLQAYAESPFDFSTEEGRISGAKRLKQLGAGQAEIEEDKRRRNTEASARFRAKKKEREQAVEKRAKDLEAQVAQLTADKASLENENRLLKAIVLNGGGGQADVLQNALSSFGKRKRDE